MAPQNILVVGATGKQGGAVVKALLGLPQEQAASPFHVLALTRDAQSTRAQALLEAHKDRLELVEGDSADPQPIFESRPKGSIAGVFIVTTPGGKHTEEQQAIPLINAAVAHGVPHLVFSSVDRGGDAKSWTNPTAIKHFASKHHIELHLRDKAAQPTTNLSWTILRPVAFLDNMEPGMMCSMFTAMWQASLSADRKLQLVAVRDIGLYAARAFAAPDEWAGRAVALAGDELTLAEARDKFAKVTGKTLPQTWTILGRAVLWGVREVGEMFNFFEKEGYGADVAARRAEAPVLDFEAWLRQESKWMKQ